MSVKKIFTRFNSAVTGLMILVLLSNPHIAFAASLLNKSDTMTSLKASTASDHTLVFRTPSGASLSASTITITFPAGFNMNSLDFGDIDLDHSAGGQSTCAGASYSNNETLAATPSASAWGAALAGQIITLTPPSDGVGAAAIAANACVRVKIGLAATGGDTQITNDSTPASYNVTIGGVFGDSGTIAITVLSDDQVSVSATVSESLTFTISDNSIGFGTLSASAARYATGDAAGDSSETEAHTLAIGTNASNGYTLTLNGATLTSGGNTVTAIGSSNTASSTGSEQFGVRMTATGGSGAVTAPYAASGFAFDSAAFPDEVASASGASATTTYSARYLANIASQTEAGSYAATLTYSASANF